VKPLITSNHFYLLVLSSYSLSLSLSSYIFHKICILYHMKTFKKKLTKKISVNSEAMIHELLSSFIKLKCDGISPLILKSSGA